MDTEQQITAVIKEVLDGNKDAFRAIVSTFQGKVYSTAFQATRDKKEAEDLTQEIFMKVFRSVSQFRFESSFSTWLYKIAIHKTMDWKRKNCKQPIFEELTAQITPSGLDAQYAAASQVTSVEEKLIRKEANAELHAIITELPEHYRQVIQMYHFQEMSYREIAHALQVPEKTVETRLYRAKQKLKEQREKEEFA